MISKLAFYVLTLASTSHSSSFFKLQLVYAHGCRHIYFFSAFRALTVSTDIVNLNGEAGASVATTGGLTGSRIKFTATAANTYMVEGVLVGSGTIATPFSGS